jgi:hypothetical protein
MESEENKESPTETEEKNPIINISALLNQAEDEDQKQKSETMCKELVLSIVENFDKPKEELALSPAPDAKSATTSPAKKKKAELTTNQIYNFISSSINQQELKNQIKQVIEMK